MTSIRISRAGWFVRAEGIPGAGWPLTPSSILWGPHAAALTANRWATSGDPAKQRASGDILAVLRQALLEEVAQ